MNSTGSMIHDTPEPDLAPVERLLFRLGIALAIALAAIVAVWADAPQILSTRFLPGQAKAAEVIFDLPNPEKQALLEATHGPLAATRVEGSQAEEINKSLPFARAPIEAAAPFRPASAAAEDRARAQLCLTQAVYYESGFEPAAGRRAVAQVILNRLRHPAFPKSVCGVVYDGSMAPGCQFSFTCDGSLRRAPAAAAWKAAAAVARAALAGEVDATVGQATHYHADYVAPYWAPKLAKITQIGAHIFYRWPGGWGLKRAFTGRYTGQEMLAAPLPDEKPAAQMANIVPLAPDEQRAPNDVGGRLDVSKGWTLSIPDPKDTRGALAQVVTSQATVALAANSDVPGSFHKATTQ